MAPEFFPFLAFIGLVVIALVGLAFGIGLAVCARHNKNVGGLPRVLSAPTFSGVGVAAIMLFVLGKSIRQQYFLNEPFVAACGQGDIVEVRQLLARGASPNAYGVDFVETALIAASRGGHRDIVSLLLRSGADIALHDSRGKTALERAKEARHGEIVSLLEEAQESP